MLHKDQDVAVFTYDPLDGFSVLPPAAVAEQVAQMLDVADDRPLLLQHIGYAKGEEC